MVPQSPPQEDLRQEDTSEGIRVPCPDGRTPAFFRSHSEPISPERREQLEKLLDSSEAELLQRLGREIAPLDQIAPVLWFVSSNGRFLPFWLRRATHLVCRYLGKNAYATVAENFLRRNRGIFRLRICIGWNYCERRDCPEVRDTAQLVSTLEAFVAHLTLGAAVSSDLVAALLVKRNLDTLCRCKARKREGVTP